MSMRVWNSVSCGDGDVAVELGVGAGLLAQADQRVGEGGGVLEAAADLAHRLVHADAVAQPLGLAEDLVERPGGGDGVEARRLPDPDRLGVHPDAEAALLAAHRHARGGPLTVMTMSSGPAPAAAARRAGPRRRRRAREPLKLAVSAMLSVEMPVTTVSCAASGSGEARRGGGAPPAAAPVRSSRARRARSGRITRSREELEADADDEEREQDAQLLGAEPGGERRRRSARR